MPSGQTDKISYTRQGLNQVTPARMFASEPLASGTRWRLCRPFGRGSIEKHHVRPGLELWSVDCRFDRDMTFHLNETCSVISFSFSISGACRIRLTSSREDIFMDSGQQGMLFFPNQTGVSYTEAGNRMRHINIQISPDRLSNYIEDDRLLLPAGLKHAIEGKSRRFSLIRAMTPAMTMAVHQICHSPLTGKAGILYLESRILELIAYQIDHLCSRGRELTHGPDIHPSDRAGVDRARNLMMRNIENPPGLVALSREAGMSHPKLNQCFRKIYGMTLFEYLRQTRLNQARILLEDQGKSVTETAYSVGYSSLSHFARVYRDHFGISPGTRVRKSG